VDVYRNGTRKQESISIQDYPSVDEAIAEAKARQHELKAAMARGQEVKGKARGQAWSLEYAVKYTDTHVWADKASRHTAVKNANACVRFFGARTTLDHIALEDLDRFVAHLKAEGNANGTINRKLAALRKVMNVARDRGKLESVPKFPRLKEPKGRIRFLSKEEEQVVLATLKAWSKEDEHDAVVALLDTGLRRGELFRVTARDVNFQAGDNGVINIWQTKADEPRSVPMTKRVKAIVEKRMGNGKLFKGLTKDALSHTFRKVRDHIGLENDTQFCIHTLRHTCASRLVQSGVAIAVVQVWLGHLDIKTTLRYSHLAPTSLLDVVHVLETEDEED